MNRLKVPLTIGVLVLAGCGGRFSDSGWNPLGWSGGPAPVASLEPEGGYLQATEQRPAVPQITGARWQPLNEGRLLVVDGFAPTKGWSAVELITVRPQPSGQVLPDADGVVRLRLVGVPPAPGSDAARLPASPATDTITTAMSLSYVELAGVTAIEIASASNVVTLRR